jgi:hypothetical protein
MARQGHFGCLEARLIDNGRDSQANPFAFRPAPSARAVGDILSLAPRGSTSIGLRGEDESDRSGLPGTSGEFSPAAIHSTAFNRRGQSFRGEPPRNRP